MNKFQNLQIESLDKKFKGFKFIEKPQEGWIKTIRLSLGIPLSFLAKKLKVTPQAVAGMEKNEIEETITLKSLRNISEALNCELHYILIPKEKSLKKIIFNEAYSKATIIVNDVDKSMILEGQETGKKEKSINSLAKELSNDISKLWK